MNHTGEVKYSWHVFSRAWAPSRDNQHVNCAFVVADIRESWLSLRRSAVTRRKYRQLIFARRPGLDPQPEGSLEAERLSLMRLSRCVIHSASGSNNAVRKGTCYRLRGANRDPPINLPNVTLEFLSRPSPLSGESPARDMRLDLDN